ncbi:MAG: hypothetical protein Q8N10_00135 [Phenylobacterium sp.]|uniref:hypothetical protein n=1 Tax=Phenylobacterium sp. TaxID=1871053 RepID=UPI0027200057|nr:hypothetical protein [Phenylobacterium sp.]MDO8911425.1 hypothetical protein [Phenylobacterium sp.]MDP3098885.1 hypothetical protein [Phenylobacterium sp.]
MFNLHAPLRRILASAIVTMALAMVWAAPALATCTPTSGGNFASIVQDASASYGVATVAQTRSVNGSACVDQGGSGATAYVRQEGGAGGSNNAQIIQIGGAGQGVYVRQQGDNNQVTVTQLQADGATSLGAQSQLSPGTLSVLANTHPRTSYAAVVFQTGSNDTARIAQGAGADGSYAEINQGTDLSTASITQNNTLTASILGNFASIIQRFAGDTGDTATVTQDGDNNYASLKQNGSGNLGQIDQTGEANSADLTQTGSGLAYAIVQDGTSTVAGGITLTGVTNVSVMQANVQTIVTAR